MCEPNATKSNDTKSCAANSSSCEEEECCAGLTCKALHAHPPYYAGEKKCVEDSNVTTCVAKSSSCAEEECCAGLICKTFNAHPPYYAGVKKCVENDTSVALTRSELAALSAEPIELSTLVEPSSGPSSGPSATCGKAKAKCDDLECCSGLACTAMYAHPPYFAGVKMCEPNATKSNDTKSCAANSSSCEEEECCAGLTCKALHAHPPYYAGEKKCVEDSNVTTCVAKSSSCAEEECCAGLICKTFNAHPPYYAGVKKCAENDTSVASIGGEPVELSAGAPVSAGGIAVGLTLVAAISLLVSRAIRRMGHSELEQPLMSEA